MPPNSNKVESLPDKTILLKVAELLPLVLCILYVMVNDPFAPTEPKSVSSVIEGVIS